MRDLLRPLLALAALLLPAPAMADVTARYVSGTATLTIEADDGGDWRFQLTGDIAMAIIQRGGAAYFIVTDRDDKVSVVRADDYIAAMMPLGTTPPEMGEFKLEAGPMESFAGYSGTTWRLKPEGEVPLEVLMSPDPALAAVGKVFRDFTALFGDRLALMPGAGDNFGDQLRLLLARGTVIRARLLAEEPVAVLELSSVSSAQIDPARFLLPGPIISADEAIAKLGPPGR